MSHRNEYEADFFALRSALLPVDAFSHWLERARGSGTEVAEAEDGRARLRRQLTAALQMPEVREAIYLASPSLSARLKAWEESPDSKKGQRIEEPLVRYFARMSGRSTPFGLFAGCSVGEIGDETTLRLPPRSEYRKRSRLDMAFVTRVTEALLVRPETKRKLTYRTNSVLHEVGGTHRYAEQRGTGARRTFHLVEVPGDEILDAVLHAARTSSSYSDLLEGIVSEGISRNEAAEFLDELIDAQVLEPCAGITVTGTEPSAAMRMTLEALGAESRVRDGVFGVLDALQEMDTDGLGQELGRYRDLQARLEEIDPELDASQLFQVDMVKRAKGLTLSREATRRIGRGAEVLYQLFGNVRNPLLESFATRFQERYGDSFQPLPQVLDEEDGIGFRDESEGTGGDGDLVRGLGLARRTAPASEPMLGIYSYLLRRMNAGASHDGAHEICLSDEDLDDLLRESRTDAPNAFGVVATAYETAASSDSTQTQHEFYVQSAIGPSGARMLGRFCHADPVLAAKVEEHLSAEAQGHPNAIMAEVVHMPAGRVGNVLSRPVFHEHEIAVLARPGADGIIALDDLLIGIRRSRIVLLHRESGREVIPRSTTAHNFDQPGVAAYRFLCHLQAQGVSRGVKWNWGPLSAMGSLPRIRYGSDVILSPRTWFLQRSDLEPLCKAEPADREVLVQRLREAWKLPRHVCYVEGDNSLPIDLENPLSVDSLARIASKNSFHHLEEVHAAYETLAVSGPEGRFAHEMVLPFLRKRPISVASTQDESTGGDLTPVVRAERNDQRFGLGSEWLFAKLYGSASSVDTVVAEHVLPLVQQWRDLGWIEGWFFIRYSDPHPHLRLRVRLKSPAHIGPILAEMGQRLEALVESRRIWKTSVEAYEPETDRYGGALGIELAEQFFTLDSELAVGICRATQDDERLSSRWKWALCTADALLRMAFQDSAARREFVAAAREGYGREYHVEGPRKRSIRDRFRSERGELEGLLRGEGELAAWIRPHLEDVERLAVPLNGFRQLEHDGHLVGSFRDVVSSLLHMHFNRLLKGDARAQEMVLYHYLDLLYASELARETKSASKMAEQRLRA